MTTYAEVNAEGLVTKVFENNGEEYTPEKGSFLVQSDRFPEGSKYQPVEGNFPPSFASLGGTAVKTLSERGADNSKNVKKQASTDGNAA